MGRVRDMAFALLVCVLALTLTSCDLKTLMSGDETAEAPVDEEDETVLVSYDFESIVYGDWRLDFARPDVVWSEEDEDDVVIISVRATYVGSKEEALLADAEDFSVFPSAKADGGGYLSVAQGTDEDGDPLYDTSAENGKISPGESIELRFAWKLDGNYDAVRLDVQGYSISDADTAVLFPSLTETVEHMAYEEAARAELEAKNTAGVVDIEGALVTRPADWRFEEATDNSTLLTHDGAEGESVSVRYRSYSVSTPLAEASKYTGYFGTHAPVAQTVMVNDEQWCYFVPAEGQFMAWAQADPGLVEARGVLCAWEDAAEVIAGISVK